MVGHFTHITFVIVHCRTSIKWFNSSFCIFPIFHPTAEQPRNITIDVFRKLLPWLKCKKSYQLIILFHSLLISIFLFSFYSCFEYQSHIELFLSLYNQLRFDVIRAILPPILDSTSEKPTQFDGKPRYFNFLFLPFSYHCFTDLRVS